MAVVVVPAVTTGTTTMHRTQTVPLQRWGALPEQVHAVNVSHRNNRCERLPDFPLKNPGHLHEYEPTSTATRCIRCPSLAQTLCICSCSARPGLTLYSHSPLPSLSALAHCSHSLLSLYTLSLSSAFTHLCSYSLLSLISALTHCSHSPLLSLTHCSHSPVLTLRYNQAGAGQSAAHRSAGGP